MNSARPNVAVIGSCVSRDPFNRNFAPSYNEKVNVVGSVYQSATPSLARTASIESALSYDLQPQFSEVIKKEYSGKNLAEVALASADIVVIDFFADVHFGITQLGGQVTTRNHMAFQHAHDADSYYQDVALSAPERMRYEAGLEGQTYRQLAMSSLETIISALNGHTRRPLIVLNSARFSKTYINKAGFVVSFNKTERFKQKNENWNAIDVSLAQVSDHATIEYPEHLFVGDTAHPWGKHPVHYAPGYYDYFWEQLDKIIAS